MDMNKEDRIVTLPKNGLRTRPYRMDMNKDIATLPKKGLKKRPYNIGMEKRDLKKDNIIWIWRRKILRNLLRDS